jgi:predicted DsbA family dithiol-disulfide isomerase
VEIWSDAVCPFCHIGEANFRKALDGFPAKDEVEVIMRSFELDPDAPVRVDHDVLTYLSRKTGGSREEVKGMTERIVRMGRGAGVLLDIEGQKLTNTFDAHRLVHLAAGLGKGPLLMQRLHEAIFADNLNVGEKPVLRKIAVDAGLPEAEVDALLEGEAFAPEVRRDEKRARELGINGVPFFLINGTIGVSGAQPVARFAEALDEALSGAAVGAGMSS